jgi:hypothetical protein
VGIYANYANKLKAQEEQIGKIQNNYGQYSSNEGMDKLYIKQTQTEEDTEGDGEEDTEGEGDSGEGNVPLLPAEYQQVEYIESTGTQYIDTEYVPNSNTNIIFDFEYKSGTSNRYIPILGQRISETEKLFALWVYESTGEVAVNFDKTDTWNISGTNGVGRHVYKNIGGNFYLDGQLISEISYNDFEASYTLAVFGLKTSASTADVRQLCGKVYSLKVYDNDILERDLVPCYRKSDNVVGLYDLVYDKFYTNAGTGTFSYE